MSLGRTIPALPVRDVHGAVAHYGERFGFEPLDRDGNLLTFYRWVTG